MGIKSDAEFGESGTAIQTDYTPGRAGDQVAQRPRTPATALDYKGTVLMRKEAQVQGVNTVKVWDCSLQCYDPRLIHEGGSAVEGQYVWLTFLPFEDKGSNADARRRSSSTTRRPTASARRRSSPARSSPRPSNDTMKANNGDPNAITRANLLTAIRNMHDFDANGMVPPIDVGGQIGEHVPGRHAGAERQVRARRPGRSRARSTATTTSRR